MCWLWSRHLCQLSDVVLRAIILSVVWWLPHDAFLFEKARPTRSTSLFAQGWLALSAIINLPYCLFWPIRDGADGRWDSLATIVSSPVSAPQEGSHDPDHALAALAHGSTAVAFAFIPFGTRHSQEAVNIDQIPILALGTLAYYSEVIIDISRWDELYVRTILEVNGRKMPERITATRQAISGRWHELEHDSDHHAERHQIENALRALSVLEIETQGW
jgi:hypothetical protein